MANATPSRLGQINGAGDALAIFLKVFGGEVLTAFDRASALGDLTTKRTIPSGKSAQFPATGLIQAYYHVPGEEILGNRVNANEIVIPIEGMLIAPAFIASIDDAMNHYDYRSIYSGEIGQALAKQYDGNLSRVLMNAARVTVPNVEGVYPGDVLDSVDVNAAYATDGAVLISGLVDGGVVLDERDVPRMGREVVVRPVQYALMLKSEKLSDYGKNAGDTRGGLASGLVWRVDGMPLRKTNNYVNTNDIGNTLQPTSRQHDYSTSQAIIAHKAASGTVALQDVTMESQWDMRRQGWLTLGKYICGHGVLRPEASYELQSSAPAG